MRAMVLAGKAGPVPLGGGYLDVSPEEQRAAAQTASSIVKGTAIAGMCGLGALLLGAVLYGLSKENAAPRLRLVEAKRSLPEWPSLLPDDPGMMPVSVMAGVHTENRRLNGVCLDEAIEFMCDGERHTVGLDRVLEIVFDQDRKAYHLRLVDGSVIGNVDMITTDLTFCTVTGLQRVALRHEYDEYAHGWEPIVEQQVAWVEKHWFDPDVIHYKQVTIGHRLNVTKRLGEKADGTMTHLSGLTVASLTGIRDRLEHALSMNREMLIKTLGENLLSEFFPEDPSALRGVEAIKYLSRLAEMEAAITPRFDLPKWQRHNSYPPTTLFTPPAGWALQVEYLVNGRWKSKLIPEEQVWDGSVGYDPSVAVFILEGQCALHHGKVRVYSDDHHPMFFVSAGDFVYLDGVPSTGSVPFKLGSSIQIGSNYKLRWVKA